MLQFLAAGTALLGAVSNTQKGGAQSQPAQSRAEGGVVGGVDNDGWTVNLGGDSGYSGTLKIVGIALVVGLTLALAVKWAR